MWFEFEHLLKKYSKQNEWHRVHARATEQAMFLINCTTDLMKKLWVVCKLWPVTFQLRLCNWVRDNLKVIKDIILEYSKNYHLKGALDPRVHADYYSKGRSPSRILTDYWIIFQNSSQSHDQNEICQVGRGNLPRSPCNGYSSPHKDCNYPRTHFLTYRGDIPWKMVRPFF